MLHLDLNGRGQGPGADARERLHPNGVNGQRSELVDGGQLIVVDHHGVPRRQLLVRIGRVVHLVSLQTEKSTVIASRYRNINICTVYKAGQVRIYLASVNELS